MLSRPSPSLHTPVIPHSLLLRVHDSVFNTLIDTGSTISFIDHDVAKSLNIDIIPSSGIIHLASSSHSLPRIGVTPPLHFTAVIVDGTLQQLTSHTHVFEVTPLATHKYHLGHGSVASAVPLQIPTSLLPHDDSVSASATRTTGPISSLIHTPIPRAPLSLHNCSTQSMS